MMTIQDNAEFSAWAIVEVVGRKAYAGRVTEQFIAGAGFIRVDIPEVDGKGGTTKCLGPRSIFNLHVTTEEIARAFVAREPECGIDAFAKLGPSNASPIVALASGDWDEQSDEDDECPF